MKRIALLLASALTGCSTYVYHSQLFKAPLDVTPRIYLEKKESELFTVQFPKSTEIIEIKRHNGGYKGRQWVSLDADSTLIAYVSRPETLGVGEIEGQEGKPICIVFPEESLNSKEYDSTFLATYANAEWCGYVNQSRKEKFSSAYP